MNSIRALVSENRKRYIDDQVNLDLSYITDRIIAMAYPSVGFEGLYRNSFRQVKKFLDTRHSGQYKVYNLRMEKQYDLSKFEHAASYPFLDHQAPPFPVLIDFCADATLWLNANPRHVVAIHCKAGKGRTGTVIAALLLHTGIAENAAEAMALYGKKRTHNMKGVTIPSQIRYVEYYDFMLKNHALYTTHKDTRIQLTQVMIHDLPESLKKNEDFVIQALDVIGTNIYKEKSTEAKLYRTQDMILFHTTCPPFQHDFQMVFTNTKGTVLFAFWLNATFIHLMSNYVVYLKKEHIDLAHHDKICKEFKKDFCVSLTFIPFEQINKN